MKTLLINLSAATAIVATTAPQTIVNVLTKGPAVLTWYQKSKYYGNPISHIGYKPSGELARNGPETIKAWIGCFGSRDTEVILGKESRGVGYVFLLFCN